MTLDLGQDPWAPATLCERCGRLLDGDPDDDPMGGAHGLPICGACARARDEEADLAMLDMRDGDTRRRHRMVSHAAGRGAGRTRLARAQPAR